MKLDDDDFTLFGLPRRFALDGDALAQRWRALQTEVHPDRFAAEGAAAQRVAMQWAVRVNEAYRRLKDPLSRAMYLCDLAGHRIDPHDENRALPPEFLARQMHWHEALADASSSEDVKLLDAEVAALLQQLRDAVQADLDERNDAAAAVPRLRQWMFLAKMRAEIERRLEALEA
jgi:molecular chaperone HscB